MRIRDYGLAPNLWHIDSSHKNKCPYSSFDNAIKYLIGLENRRMDNGYSVKRHLGFTYRGLHYSVPIYICRDNKRIDIIHPLRCFQFESRTLFGNVNLKTPESVLDYKINVLK